MSTTSTRLPAQGGGEHVWTLVDEAKAGNRAALSTLYELYIGDVLRFVRARVHDPHLAEDLTSETFVRAMRRMDSLSHRGSTFRAWLITIARNLVLDEAKSGRNRREVMVAEYFDSPAPAIDPAEQVCTGQVVTEALRALSELPSDQRECLELRYLREFSVAEVAQAMRRPAGAVRALQFRGVRRLKQALMAGQPEALAG